MAIQLVGPSGNVIESDSLKSLYSRPQPVPGDHFRACFKTTSLAFTTGVNIVSFRNPAATPILIHRCRARIKPMAIFTPAAGGIETTLSWFICRSWTVLGTTNRTALVLTGNNNKVRASMNTSGAEMGFASATGGFTGDTIGAVDANPFCQDSGTPQNVSTTAAASPGAGTQDSFDTVANYQADVAAGEYPIILVTNEGLRLVYTLTGTAAAIMILGEIVWSEIAAYPAGD